MGFWRNLFHSDCLRRELSSAATHHQEQVFLAGRIEDLAHELEKARERHDTLLESSAIEKKELLDRVILLSNPAAARALAMGLPISGQAPAQPQAAAGSEAQAAAQTPTRGRTYLPRDFGAMGPRRVVGLRTPPMTPDRQGFSPNSPAPALAPALTPAPAPTPTPMQEVVDALADADESMVSIPGEPV